MHKKLKDRKAGESGKGNGPSDKRTVAEAEARYLNNATSSPFSSCTSTLLKCKQCPGHGKGLSCNKALLVMHTINQSHATYVN